MNDQDPPGARNDKSAEGEDTDSYAIHKRHCVEVLERAIGIMKKWNGDGDSTMIKTQIEYYEWALSELKNSDDGISPDLARIIGLSKLFQRHD